MVLEHFILPEMHFKVHFFFETTPNLHEVSFSLTSMGGGLLNSVKIPLTKSICIIKLSHSFSSNKWL